MPGFDSVDGVHVQITLRMQLSAVRERMRIGDTHTAESDIIRDMVWRCECEWVAMSMCVGVCIFHVVAVLSVDRYRRKPFEIKPDME